MRCFSIEYIDNIGVLDAFSFITPYKPCLKNCLCIEYKPKIGPKTVWSMQYMSKEKMGKDEAEICHVVIQDIETN